MSFSDDFAERVTLALADPNSVLTEFRGYLIKQSEGLTSAALASGDTDFTKGQVAAYRELIQLLNRSVELTQQKQRPTEG